MYFDNLYTYIHSYNSSFVLCRGPEYMRWHSRYRLFSALSSDEIYKKLSSKAGNEFISFIIK
jgi:hypothetical protein